VKAQGVRLLDVFLLGPLMIYVARRYRLHEPERTLLLWTGIGTILYNGFNYMQLEAEAALQGEYGQGA
jgi:hypothetical protein